MAVGENGGEVEPRPHPPGGQDGGRRVGGLGVRVVRHADGGAQVALVGGDAGVDRRSNEGGGSGGRDDERLGTSPALQFGLSVFVRSRIALLILEGIVMHVRGAFTAVDSCISSGTVRPVLTSRFPLEGGTKSAMFY